MEASLFVVTFAAILSAYANKINEQCHVHNETSITCTCTGNEVFFLPDEYNYKNIISVSIAGCASANLHYSSLPEATALERMVVQNIDGLLDFSVYITSSRMKLLRLSNIGRIPVIANHTFVTLTNIDTLEIENARIEDFQEDFSFINVSRFVMRNVTVERVNRLNLLNGATTLSIVNSELWNIAMSLYFDNFRNIEIVGSKFELQKANLLSVRGNVVVVRDSVFLNASMSLAATQAIAVRGVCADGKSTLRLSSANIDSSYNRLPNEIAYLTENTRNPESDEAVKPIYARSNNTVCKAGNCECLKSSGQATTRRARVSALILVCLTMSLSRGLH